MCFFDCQDLDEGEKIEVEARLKHLAMVEDERDAKQSDTTQL